MKNLSIALIAMLVVVLAGCAGTVWEVELEDKNGNKGKVKVVVPPAPVEEGDGTYPDYVDDFWDGLNMEDFYISVDSFNGSADLESITLSINEDSYTTDTRSFDLIMRGNNAYFEKPDQVKLWLELYKYTATVILFEIDHKSFIYGQGYIDYTYKFGKHVIAESRNVYSCADKRQTSCQVGN